jgi:FKBP-type peptidyl-prolyl cis-trans isomerase
MLKMKKSLLFGLVFLTGLFGCENGVSGDGGGYKTTESGLKYQFLVDEEGPAAQVGNIITFEMALYKNEDSLITSTYETGQTQKTMLQEPGFSGDLFEGLAMMSVGDSAVFEISMDSLFKGRMEQMPPFLKGGKFLTYRIKMEKIQTEEEVKAEMEAKAEEQKQIDDQKIQDYLSENGIEAEKTESGIYYTITAPGDGEHPSIQNQVTVHYTGKLLNGNIFDSSIPENMPSRQLTGEPVTFPLAGVVKGWQEGIPLLERGGSGVLYIPSYMAYGAQSPSPSIPPNSVLIFEVDLIDFK